MVCLGQIALCLSQKFSVLTALLKLHLQGLYWPRSHRHDDQVVPTPAPSISFWRDDFHRCEGNLAEYKKAREREDVVQEFSDIISPELNPSSNIRRFDLLKRRNQCQKSPYSR